ncbi:MAG TPA: exo-alpha-sialidase, partial [Isosphaeraceae bacterium]|nr:exo-alpha-sialidase [Isosphaeraceae bacterium]
MKTTHEHRPKSATTMDRRGFLAVTGSVAAGAVEFLAGACAQANGKSEFTVGPVRRVGAEGAKYFEPWIAANPRDGSNLVIVGSRYLGEAATRATERMEPVAWFTADGGATWSAGEFEGTALWRRGLPYFADSYASYAPDGTAFCVFNGSPEGDRLDLWIYHSDDGGRHWRGPTILASSPTRRGLLDYPRLAADLNGGKPRLFVAVAVDGNAPILGKWKRPGYGCAILRSDDGARTFSVVNFLAPT